jgi:hypothetical protein
MHTEHGGSLDDDAEGFFLLHRRIKHGPYYLNPGLLQTLVYCLSHAAFRAVVVPMRTGHTITRVELQAGQFITGRNAGAAELAIAPGTFWGRMQKMADLGTISIESNNHFSVVTVCNWASYQNAKTKRRQRPNSEPTASRQQADSDPSATRQQADTKKQLLTIKNNEEQVPEGSGPASDLDAILETWNATAGTLKIRALGDTRQRHLRVRLSDPQWLWRDALAKFPLPMCASDPTGWQPDFDWFIKPDSVTRILEGKYDFTKKDNRHANRPTASSQQYDPNKKLGPV